MIGLHEDFYRIINSCTHYNCYYNISIRKNYRITNTIVSLLSVSKAQRKLVEHTRTRRLVRGLTQEGLAVRSGVSLPTLRKFEQKGLISLESFLKFMMVLDGLESLVDAIKPEENKFSSIDEVLAPKERVPKRGRR